MYCCIDIETYSVQDDFPLLFVAKTVDQGCEHFSTTSLVKMREYLESHKDDRLVFHNGVSFDCPALEKHLPMQGFFTPDRVLDTLVLSRMLFPDRQKHGLRAWGEDLGILKGDFDFENWDGVVTAELIWYCKRDVDVTEAVLKECLFRIGSHKKAWRTAHNLEYKVRQSVDNQQPFYYKNSELKEALAALEGARESIQDAVYPTLEPVPAAKSRIKHPPKHQFKIDGTPSAHATRYFPDIQETDNGYVFKHPVTNAVLPLPHTEPLYTQEPCTFDNLKYLKESWIEQGWKPLNWNKKKTAEGGYENTSPKHQDDKGEIDPWIAKNVPYSAELQEWLTLNSRINVLRGWESRGVPTIHSRGDYSSLQTNESNTLGARTGRFAHRNVANVPRITSQYGDVLRGLLGPEPGHKQVGWDASALEACMEAHEIAHLDPEYADALTDGTLHDRNAELFGVTRDQAKTLKYALLYGAKKGRISKLLNISERAADDIINQYWKEANALLEVKNALEHEFEKTGWITAIDGRKLQPASKHAALNTRLQGNGAIVMKVALLWAQKSIREHYNQADAYPIIRYHDEEQWGFNPETARGDTIGALGCQSITKAGELLKVRVPLAGEYMIGNNWAQCH